MKKLLAIAALAAAFSGCSTIPAEAIRVGTYNIRLSPGDRGTPNAWEERKVDMVQLLKDLRLDAFGLQEVCPDQAQYLRENLPDFEFVGDHREKDRVSGEASPVFYRKARFDAEKRGTFWLSETPDVPASKSWGTCCTRVCSYLILRDRMTGKRFCFANTHTDHVSAEAREKGMLLIIERMREFGAGSPIVFAGDHNNTEIEAPAKSVAKVLGNALYLTETPATGPWRTWNGWRWLEEEVGTGEALRLPPDVRNIANNDVPAAGKATADGKASQAQEFYSRCSGPRIDYIWVSGGVRVLDYATVGATRPGKMLYPSDHFPVTATLLLP